MSLPFFQSVPFHCIPYENESGPADLSVDEERFEVRFS